MTPEEQRRYRLILDEERKSRVTLKCRCGVRLDVVGLMGGRWMINNWKGPRERGLREEIAGRSSRGIGSGRPLRNFELRQPDPFGGAINYRCGKCGAHYPIHGDRLVDAAKRRHKAGGRVLVAGIDI